MSSVNFLWALKYASVKATIKERGRGSEREREREREKGDGKNRVRIHFTEKNIHTMSRETPAPAAWPCIWWHTISLVSDATSRPLSLSIGIWLSCHLLSCSQCCFSSQGQEREGYYGEGWDTGDRGGETQERGARKAIKVVSHKIEGTSLSPSPSFSVHKPLAGVTFHPLSMHITVLPVPAPLSPRSSLSHPAVQSSLWTAWLTGTWWRTGHLYWLTQRDCVVLAIPHSDVASYLLQRQ